VQSGKLCWLVTLMADSRNTADAVVTEADNSLRTIERNLMNPPSTFCGTVAKKVNRLAKTSAESVSSAGSSVLNGTLTLLKNPEFQTVTLSTAGGAIVLGTIGGAFGCVSGLVIGSGTGLVPALITFGLSVPIGGMLGGGLGAVSGIMLGSASGATAGGCTSYIAYRFHAEIRDGVLYVTTSVSKGASYTKDKVTVTAMKVRSAAQTTICDATADSKRCACNAVSTVADYSKKTASNVGKSLIKAKETAVAAALDTECQKTAGCAVGGAVVFGAAGGAAGTVTGAAVGIAVGVVPALFTFGLSVPVGAMIGGGLGMTVGGATGSTAGFAACGASFAYRREISSKAAHMYDGACHSLSAVKSRARTLVGSTGGTSA